MLGTTKEQRKAIRTAITGKIYCFECKKKTKLNKEQAKKTGIQKCKHCGTKLFDLTQAEKYKEQLTNHKDTAPTATE